MTSLYTGPDRAVGDADDDAPDLAAAAQRLLDDWDGLQHGLWNALKSDVAALRVALNALHGTEGDG